MNFDWLEMPVAELNRTSQRAAEQHQATLTKPPGALGRLETIAIRLAAMQGVVKPELQRIHIVVFAADHGVVAEGVSAFPQAVTTEMVRNFASGGAAISVLARELGAGLRVVNLGTVMDTGMDTGTDIECGIDHDASTITHLHLGPGTANFTSAAAMTAEQLARALNVGRQNAERAFKQGAQLFIGGEMGIGNTTSAAAMACALLNAAPQQLVGPGTGLDSAGIKRKVAVVTRALAFHQEKLDSPLAVLQQLGGFEIAALCGAYIAAAKMGLPLLIDGFITTVAALLAERISPGTAAWFFYSHASAEPGHQHVIAALAGEPLLDFGMRLGEGSGAAVSVPILRLACALHNNMATFAAADVSQKI